MSDAIEGSSNDSQTTKVLKICNKRGLHARASAKFVKCVEGFESDIKVSKDGHIVGGTSIMGLMMLAAGDGCTIHVSATGSDATQALSALEELINDKFGEGE